MALNLTNLFTALGRIGRNAYIIHSGAQDLQETPFDTLIGYAYINPAWIASLTASYDAAIRVESAGMSVWAAAAQTILQQFVLADAPAYGSSLGDSLSYLLSQMIDQTETVKECTITKTVTPDAANVGTPVVYTTVTRYDGLIQQNTIAEVGAMVFTDDSYTGSATRNQEPWQWSGAPNLSSLGTGTAVGTWDWDWPQGSASTVTGNNIDAAQDATASGNYLTNGDFEDWDSSSPVKLNYWYLRAGVYGTDIKRSSANQGIDGLYALEWIADTAVITTLTQQFDSAISDPADATAGTDVELTAFKTYILNVFIKASGVVTGGVLTFSLVGPALAVIDDEAGNPNSATVALTGHSTSWTEHTMEFRLPVRLPTSVRLMVQMSTALTGANILMDYITFAQPTQLYPGGPYLVSFANPAAPVEAGPDPDGFVVSFTNDRGGASFGATFQTLISRLFQTPDVILPYDSSPSIADTLITNA